MRKPRNLSRSLHKSSFSVKIKSAHTAFDRPQMNSGKKSFATLFLFNYYFIVCDSYSKWSHAFLRKDTLTCIGTEVYVNPIDYNNLHFKPRLVILQTLMLVTITTKKCVQTLPEFQVKKARHRLDLNFKSRCRFEDCWWRKHAIYSICSMLMFLQCSVIITASETSASTPSFNINKNPQVNTIMLQRQWSAKLSSLENAEALLPGILFRLLYNSVFNHLHFQHINTSWIPPTFPYFFS